MDAFSVVFEAGYSLNQKFFELPVKWLHRTVLRGKTGTSHDAVFTFPNAVSLTRILLACGIWVWHDSVAISTLLLLAASASDVIDGLLARKMGVTRSGAIVDPTCDKIFVITTLLAFQHDLWPYILTVTLVTEGFIFSGPFIAMLAGVVRYQSADFKANSLGKTKFALQCVALAALVLGFGKFGSVLLWIAWVFAVGSITKKALDNK